MIETAMNMHFSFDINHVHYENDDCAHIFVEKKIIQLK